MGIDYHMRHNSYSTIMDSPSDNIEYNKSRGHHFIISATVALLFFWFLYATFIMGFRGDFSADYNSYVLWFNRIKNMSDDTFWQNFGLKNIFSVYLETGYAVLNRIVGHFTDNPVWLFAASAIIICFPVYKLVRKNEKPWLAILLWISIGPYLESFNTMRGAMAASILIFSLKYIHERKLVKYVLVVLLATLFHSTAILMVVAYFLPLIKPTKKTVFIMAVFAAVVSTVGELLTLKFNNIFHIAYDDAGALELFNRYKSSGLSLIVPLIIEILAFYVFFKLVRTKKIDTNDPYIRMVFNGNLIWIFFVIMQMFTGYSTRFAMLFFYYPCIFVSLLAAQEKEKKWVFYLIGLLASAWFLINALVRYPAFYFAI